jgi:hypothetical protein
MKWVIKEWLRTHDYEIHIEEIKKKINRLPEREPLRTEHFITEAEGYYIRQLELRMDHTNDQFSYNLYKETLEDILGRAKQRGIRYKQEVKAAEEQKPIEQPAPSDGVIPPLGD